MNHPLTDKPNIKFAAAFEHILIKESLKFSASAAQTNSHTLLPINSDDSRENSFQDRSALTEHRAWDHAADVKQACISTNLIHELG